ncbi:uncharacterized protein LOC113214959 [Frankliniella occidentalis]|uniref:Uncharacterized protein LOC113214959 n=1 Tax=Frankliniella occidentalis TaxID=133901 RepID=A0A9C6X7H3_FRAOC|nr:uncharacterized protein LOC113214959 [Frankliniella occidentalis]
MYVCTCPDWSPLCKHVHAVVLHTSTGSAYEISEDEDAGTPSANKRVCPDPQPSSATPPSQKQVPQQTRQAVLTNFFQVCRPAQPDPQPTTNCPLEQLDAELACPSPPPHRQVLLNLDIQEEQELEPWELEEPLTEFDKEALDIFHTVGDGLVTVDEQTADILRWSATRLPVTYVYTIDREGLPMATLNTNVRHGNWMVIATNNNSAEEIARAVRDAEMTTGISMNPE